MLRPALAALAATLALVAPRVALAEPAAAPAVLVDKIAAVVAEVTILRSDVLAAARPFYAKIGRPEEHAAEVEQLHKEILGRMIEDVLVAREARRLNLQVNDAEIEQAKEWIAKQNNLTKAQLESEVRKQGVGKEEYEGELHRQLTAEKWVALKVRPRVKMAAPTSNKPEDQAPFIQALETERKKLVDELRQAAYVEVRW
jgi:parvulin-like peptidyl-prolyl isomerase